MQTGLLSVPIEFSLRCCPRPLLLLNYVFVPRYSIEYNSVGPTISCLSFLLSINFPLQTFWGCFCKFGVEGLFDKVLIVAEC